MVTVMIVDDHQKFGDVLKSMLAPEPDISVVGQVCDSREASAIIRQSQPQVVLMDYNMPHLNGIELSKLLLDENPELKILFLSMYNEERLIETFKDIGARGYLSKTASAHELIRATRKVSLGEFYFPETDATKTTDNEVLDNLKLSTREMEVVRLIKLGLKVKDIAETLNISSYTAEAHWNNIKLKTGIKSDVNFIRFIKEMRLRL